MLRTTLRLWREPWIPDMRVHVPGFAAGALVLGLVACACAAALHMTGGPWAYPLDDTYIHLAMARTLAESGTWGLHPGAFQPASSSPAWTLILGGIFWLLGTSQWTPLLLNAVFAVATALVVNSALAGTIQRSKVRFAATALILFLVPVAPVAVASLEHLLHTLTYLIWLRWYLLQMSGNPQEGTARSTGVMAAIAFLLAAVNVSVRFESLFTVAVVCVMGAWRRKWVVAVATGLGALGALGAYGAWAVSQGGQWLPNSVLLKGSGLGLTASATLAEFLTRVPRSLGWPGHMHMTDLLALATILWLIPVRSRQPDHQWAKDAITVFVLAGILHIQFARLGSFYRYEAYLITTGLVAITIIITGILRSVDRRWIRLGIVTGACVLILPLCVRAVRAHVSIPLASRNIYEQQVQMANFVSDYYENAPIGANDIGALSFLGRGRVLDLWGLAETDIAMARRDGRYGTSMIERVTLEYGAEMIVVYDSWFTRFGGLPNSWVRVGQWSVRNNVVLGGDVVTFYASTEEFAEVLAENLRRFGERLPARVHQSGPYLEPSFEHSSHE